MKTYIKNRKRQSGCFQFYMQQFVEAAVRQGIKPRNMFLLDFSMKLNTFFSAARHQCSSLFGKKSEVTKPATHVTPAIAGNGIFRRGALAFYSRTSRNSKQKAILITSRGEALFRNAFPFFYRYEIIPMLWDVWPNSWDSLYRDLKQLNCKVVFVTVRSMAQKISSDLGIKAYWVPEGIDKDDYKSGEELCHRSIDVYELGRQQREYHALLEEQHQRGAIGRYCRNLYNEQGRLQQLAFPTAASLIEGLADIKIIISFPQVDTHPQKAGGLDTLTQRYWEAMLSRCLLMGRAPQELIDFIGYNPVIDVDWKNPVGQLQAILSDIASYQPLVDKNYATALEKASWDSRMPGIVNILQKEGYRV